jgi:hypothetical protein
MQHRVMERIIMPALVALGRGIAIEAYDTVPELRRVGSLYMFVGDMIGRQEALMLKAYTPPMSMPGAHDDDPIDAPDLRIRSMQAHVALIEWAVLKLAVHGMVTIARKVLDAAGCLSKVGVHFDVFIRHHELAKWRSLGALLIGPDPLHQHCGIIVHVLKHTLAHYEKSIIGRFNDAVRDYPRHPNIIHQNLVVQTYVSKQTGGRAVGMMPLSSEETSQLLRILPETLLIAKVEPAYIEPIIELQLYVDELHALSTAPSAAAALAVRQRLASVLRKLRALDYRSFETIKRAAAAAGAAANNDDDNDGDAGEPGADDDDGVNDDDAIGQPRWRFPKARDEPSSAEMIANVAPLRICSTRLAEQGHQKAKFFGGKRSNFAGDREKALLDRVSMFECVRADVDSASISRSANDTDTRALGPIRYARDGFPRRCRVTPEGLTDNAHDANATMFRGMWLDHHKIYIGAFVYVTTNANIAPTHRIGCIDAIFVCDGDDTTHVLLKLYQSSGDCAVTRLVLLAPVRNAYERVALVSGTVIKLMCVTNVDRQLRWNERVPCVVMRI